MRGAAESRPRSRSMHQAAGEIDCKIVGGCVNHLWQVEFATQPALRVIPPQGECYDGCVPVSEMGFERIEEVCRANLCGKSIQIRAR